MQVKVRGHAGTNVTPSPTNLNFTPSNWRQLQSVSVSTDTDANTTNESVRLNHTAVSSDSLFDGVTVPSVIVNVDDQDAPDHHIHTIRPPQGSYALPPGDKVLPEEEITVRIVDGGVEHDILVVAEGHLWRPSGLWGDPDADTVWVVDPNHFGIHALKLSALKQGRIERHIAANASEIDYRLNYRCHFREDQASVDGNPSLTVMWGIEDQLWIANESSVTLDAYDRGNDISTTGCRTRNVTSWDSGGQGYEWADEDFGTPFEFLGGVSLSRGPQTVRGIWANGTHAWLSGPNNFAHATDVYTFPLGSSSQMAIAPGYDGHTGSSYGLWSDGTTMWVATWSGWLRAYNLNSGIRSAEFDIRIQTYGMSPGDMWSDGETIWVTNRTGKIDAYHLPDRPYASSGSRTPRATEAETRSRRASPWRRRRMTGGTGFKLRIAFSDDCGNNARRHAGSCAAGERRHGDRCRDGEGPQRPVGADALCSRSEVAWYDGTTRGPGLHRPGSAVHGGRAVADRWARPRGARSAGRRPSGRSGPTGGKSGPFLGGVDLEWNEVPGADSYDVQQYRGGQWTGLPADGVAIAFYGAGAIISGLDPQSSLWFRVRAANGHGVSDWSEMLYMNSTSQFKSGRQARPDNEPASGAPVVHGTAQVGESLWADASGIEDGNGLDRVQFQYQWMSNDGSADTDIAGATDSGYTLAADDVGRTIKVKVAFTDRGGYSETRTGAATGAVAAAPNNPATGKPAISGTAQVGETLTVDTSGIADADGLDNATYSYQWMAGGTEIPGATGPSYTLVSDDEGKTIQVWVGFIDDARNEEALASAATEAVGFAVQQQGASNTPATGEPTISGTAQVGETLTADTSGITDADGLVNATFSYQWVANDGATDTDISGATDAAYTLVDDDGGRTIKVRVLVTDDLGNETTLTSEATDEVDFAVQQQGASNTPTTGLPTISGTAQVGEMLTADTTGIADADGLDNATYSYQWLSDDAEIGGATDSTYTLVDGDEGRTIKVRVIVTDDAENETTLTSAATDAVEAAAQPDSPATGAPTITGTAQVGEMLTADTTGIADVDGLDNATYSYQWLSDDAEIGGATGSTYTLVDDDEGRTIKVRVIVTDDLGSETTLTSGATAVVAFPEPPAKPTGLSAAVSHDAVALTWDDPQDDSITGYVILRRDRAIHPVGTFVTIAGDTGSTDTTYTDATVEPEKEYVYRIKAINEHGEVSERSDWVRGFTPAAPPTDSPATGKPTISGTAQVGETLTADTSGIADADGLTKSTYSYQWVASDGATDTDISGATDAAYTLVDDDAGRTIKVMVLVTDDAGNETTLTSEATDAVEAAAQPDSAATGEPTISGTAQVGEMLTADTSGIADADGLVNATYSYQWLSDDAEISGATGSTYTLVDDDEGRTIKVQVLVTDDLGNETTLTSEATDAVEAAAQPDSAATGAPTITGTVQVGQTLTADTSGIADADGLVNATYSYQWLSDDAEISGATGSTYTLVDDDEGRTIKVRVTVTDDLGNETTLTSAATEAVDAKRNTAATGRPAISGTVRVGETLTADTSGIADADGLTNVSYRYQWVVTDGGAYIDISGETGATYTLVSADRGLRILVRVSFTDDAGTRERLTSAATDRVAAAP